MNVRTWLILAALLGFGQAMQLYSWDFIIGQGAFWQIPPPDTAQLLISLRYFEAEAWHWPLTHIATLGTPAGLSIANTGMPLIALLAKAVQPLFTDAVNPFGPYLVLIMVLQPVTMVWLLHEIGVRSRIGLLCGAVIALSFPAFLFRVFHIALMGHFLVIAALALYFATRHRPSRRLWAAFVGLSLLTMLIYVYLAVMVDGILVAAAIADVLRSKRAGMAALVISIGGSLLILWGAEYLSVGGGTFRASGFGRFSMNLLSPLVPQMSSLLPVESLSVLKPVLSAVPPANSIGFAPGDFILDATGGQYEGMNYLGAGLLLLLGFVAVASGRRLLSRDGRRAAVLVVRRHWPLLAVLLSFTLFAVSNEVYVAFYHLHYDLPVPAAFLDQLRSSGRFFWPVGYALAAGLILAVLRLAPPRVAGTVLVIAAGLQYADAADLRHYVSAMTRTPGRVTLPPAPWQPLVLAHDDVTIYPLIHCAGLKAQLAIVDLLLDASRRAIPINTMYTGRPPDDCVASARTARSSVLDDGGLHIFFDEQFSWGAIRDLAGAARLCRRFDGGHACTDKWPALESDGFLPGFAAAGGQQYQLGQTIALATGAGEDYRGWGWWPAGNGDAWIYGGSATLTLDLAEPPAPGDLEFHFRGHASLLGNSERILRLSVQGKTVAEWPIADAAMHDYEAILPAASPVLQLQFAMEGGKSLRDMKLDTDNRRLDFSMESFALSYAAH